AFVARGSALDHPYDHMNAASGLFELLTFLPSIAVWVRRLHDVGRSGLWWLLALIPLIGWIILFYWSVRRGDEGPNDYGPDPIMGGESHFL
ncbi:MAG: DUF805 domain-containing protein, partial [Rhodobacteraceae bacterium]|nr:DUF805 domain-containing protein [Paracoccaceae bacterium]